MNACSDQCVTVNICMLFPMPIHISVFMLLCKSMRSRQDSNLRGETPMDFQSIALTTRPRLPWRMQPVNQTWISHFMHLVKKTLKLNSNMVHAVTYLTCLGQIQRVRLKKGKMRYTTSAMTRMSVLAGQLSWLERRANNANVVGSIPILAMV